MKKLDIKVFLLRSFILDFTATFGKKRSSVIDPSIDHDQYYKKKCMIFG